MESIRSYTQIIQSHCTLPEIDLSRNQRLAIVAVALAIFAVGIAFPVVPIALDLTLSVIVIIGGALFTIDICRIIDRTIDAHEERCPLKTENISITQDVEKISQRDIILRLKAKKDPNGALDLIRSVDAQKIKNEGIYDLVVLEVKSVQGIVSAIEQMSKQGNRIKTLHLHIHGSPNVMELSEAPSKHNWNDLTFISNREKLRPYCIAPLKKAFTLLEKDATIIIQSCSTGKVDGEGTVCMAQSIAGIAEGRKVFAPTFDGNSIGTELLFSETGIEARFYEPNISQLYGKLKIIKSLVLGEGLSSGAFENKTACFRDIRPKETSQPTSKQNTSKARVVMVMDGFRRWVGSSLGK